MNFRSAVFCLCTAVSPAMADDGAYAAAYDINVEFPIAAHGDGAREVFWLINLGGDDLVDAYKLLPAPAAGEVLVVGGGTETNTRPDVTLELVKRFGGEVVASANLSGDPTFANWVVTAPVYLRVTAADDVDKQEILIGIQIFPAGATTAGRSEATSTTDFKLPIPENATDPVPKLVVPADR